MLHRPYTNTPIDELVNERLSAEKEARKKKQELKREYRKARK
jgi:hypothetical protein